jgi:hypothetical protein
MAKFGHFRFGECFYGPGVCPTTPVVIIKNISRKSISIFIEPDFLSDIAPDLDGYTRIISGGSITVEDDRVNNGWLESLRMLNQVTLEYKDELDPV